MWTLVAEVAAAAAKAVQGYLQDRADARERQRKQAALLDAIERSRVSILDAVHDGTISELRGTLLGFETRYAEYDGDPSSHFDEHRLVTISSEAAVTIGWLSVNIDRLFELHDAEPAHVKSAATDLALESAAILIPLLYLRAQVMTEHQITYGAAEVRDIPRMLKAASERLDRLRAAVRRQSDARFGRVGTLRHADYEGLALGYSFGGRTYLCGGADRPGTADACEDRRARHMQRAYAGFRDGAGPVLTGVVRALDAEQARLLRPGSRLPVPGTHAPPAAVTAEHLR